MGPKELQLDGVTFCFVSVVEPERIAPGGPFAEHMPQHKYAKATTARLNPNGAGPFCRVRVKGLPSRPGVYTVVVNGSVAYVGKAQDIAERWGPRGYGLISPKNCFVGGQSTNCKMNHRILLAAKQAQVIEIWVYEAAEPGPTESRLIRALTPPWNSQIPS